MLHALIARLRQIDVHKMLLISSRSPSCPTHYDLIPSRTCIHTPYSYALHLSVIQFVALQNCFPRSSEIRPRVARTLSSHPLTVKKIILIINIQSPSTCPIYVSHPGNPISAPSVRLHINEPRDCDDSVLSYASKSTAAQTVRQNSLQNVVLQHLVLHGTLENRRGLLRQQTPILSNLNRQEAAWATACWAVLVHARQICRVCRHVSVHKVSHLQGASERHHSSQLTIIDSSYIIDNSFHHRQLLQA